MKLFKLIMLVVAVIFSMGACSGGGSSSVSNSVYEVEKEINTNRTDLNKIENKEIQQENKDIQQENKDIQQENKDIQQENKDIQQENKEIQQENKEIQQENKNNEILVKENDVTDEINQQVSQQNQENIFSLKSYTDDSNIKNISYLDYGYVDLMDGGNKVRTFFYKITDENAQIKVLPEQSSIAATYNGKAYMSVAINPNDIEVGTLFLNIDSTGVSGYLEFPSKYIELENTQLTANGYTGQAVVKELVYGVSQSTGEEGSYKGVLAGGSTKLDMTIGTFKLEKNNVETVNGLFYGSTDIPERLRTIPNH
ncbi:hypothetical protein ACFFHT_06760 [Gallibacterium melopsittaci]|uniref:Factor H binding protein C-terminal domain-containing protein n=1 Tax=Gallibacterium melopsittaci TaxID=516063 RepID=A0ABV6HX89_9PAST